MPRPIAAERFVTLPHAPEGLGPWVANTQRMDRAVRLPEALFRRVERAEGGAVVTGEYRLRRLTGARWREYPLSWQKRRHYTTLREHERGPVRRFFGGAELEPVDESRATRFRVHSEFTPRNLLFTPSSETSCARPRCAARRAGTRRSRPACPPRRLSHTFSRCGSTGRPARRSWEH
jgi:hypothetical protein